MKKVLALSMVVITLLSFAACGTKENGAGNDNTVPPQAEQGNASSATDQPGDAAPAKAVVSLDYATEALLGDKNAYEEFVDSSSEYEVKGVFTANTTVRQFKYVELSYNDTTAADTKISFHVEKVLYSADVLSPEKPLVVTMELEGAIPNRGITYLDENGTERFFTISMSGQDASLLLSEFT